MNWQLQSDRLAVTVSHPGTNYRGSRFDWTGFILQVVLDGRHAFCVEESDDDTGSGGIGLCNEFGILTAVGYNTAKNGEQFIKPGIGLLTRTNEEPYAFFRPYPVEPFPISTVATHNEICFTIDPVPHHGYAMQLLKKLKVAGNNLSIVYMFENVGQHKVLLDEYCHNFIAINGIGPCKDIMLKLPADLLPEKRCCDPMMITDGGRVTWSIQPQRAFQIALSQHEVAAANLNIEDCWWEMTHLPTGVTVREQTDFVWSRFVLFGTNRLVSPRLSSISALPQENA